MKTKILILTTCLSLIAIRARAFTTNPIFENSPTTKEMILGSPVILDVLTNYKTIKEALLATKMALMEQKFIATNGIQETSFTAKRTSGSHADYYIADVMASKLEDGTINVTITFMKIGSGMLKLSKVSRKVKAKLSVKGEVQGSTNVNNNTSFSGIQGGNLQLNIGKSGYDFIVYDKDDKGIKGLTIIGSFNGQFNKVFGYGLYAGMIYSTVEYEQYNWLLNKDVEYLRKHKYVFVGPKFSINFYNREKAQIFSSIGLGIGQVYKEKYEDGTLTEESKSNNLIYTYDLQFGFNYYVNKKIGITASLGTKTASFRAGVTYKI